MSVRRCDQDGTPNNSGAYCLVSYTLDITALNNHNSKALVLKYKKRNASTYTSVTLSVSSYTESSSSIFPADTDSTYDVQLVVSDDFSSSTRSTNLSTAYAYLNFGNGTTAGIGIGMVSQTSKAIEIEENWKVFHGAKQILPNPASFLYDACADNGSVSFAVEGNTSGVLLVSGVAFQAKDLIIYHANATGDVTFRQMIGATGFSVSVSANTITLANSSGAYLFVLAIVY